MTSTYSHFLNGQAVASDSDQHSDVFNPATGEVIAKVPMATPAELAQAVAHAKDAAAVWGDMPSARRARGGRRTPRRRRAGAFASIRR